jgi:hypothetical protein
MARDVNISLVATSAESGTTTTLAKFLYSLSASYGEVLKAQYPVGGSLNLDLEIGNFTTLNYFMVYNRHTMDYGTVTYTSTGGGAARTVRVPAGTVLVLGDVAPASGVTLGTQSATLTLDVLGLGD